MRALIQQKQPAAGVTADPGLGFLPMPTGASLPTVPRWLIYAAVALVAVIILRRLLGNSNGARRRALTRASAKYTAERARIMARYAK